MRLDPFPRFPADSGQLIRKLTDLFRDTAKQVNDLTEGRVSAVTNAATTVPTTGTWKQGDFVRNSAPSIVNGGQTLLGWFRLTSGSTNVSGTDWVEARSNIDANLPQRTFSANYTLVLDDGGRSVLHPSPDTTARTLTIPANSSVAFPLGAVITVINQNGAGVVSIAITTDTLRLAGSGTTGTRTLAANGICTLYKETATEWRVSGTGVT